MIVQVYQSLTQLDYLTANKIQTTQTHTLGVGCFYRISSVDTEKTIALQRAYR